MAWRDWPVIRWFTGGSIDVLEALVPEVDEEEEEEYVAPPGDPEDPAFQ